ncbi:hypothetical protein [Zavarzinia sp.]|uniref:hypothetical protein n=1 Tax=Zavarzinia sp. TaxID=2027920 RepID=UPI003563A677
MASTLAVAPGTTDQNAARSEFDRTVEILRADVAAAASHMTLDGAARATYDRLIRGFSEQTRLEVERGGLTWTEAADRAHRLRNMALDAIRGRSTAVGRAFAEQLKAQGRSLNELIARKTLQLFGADADFGRLSPAQRDRVFAAIVEAAGKSNPRVTAMMRGLSVAGRALLVVSIAVTVYTVATAKDPAAAARHEGAVLGAGIAGSMASGALAGLACGPGAPVCVTIGAFVGGTLAAFGASMVF